MLAHALLNELFNVFPILIHVKVCVWAMLSFQKRKRVLVLVRFDNLSVMLRRTTASWVLPVPFFFLFFGGGGVGKVKE